MTRGLELLIAQTILQGFDAQYGRFLEVTSGAQQRFEQADWHAVQQAMKQRIHLYDHHVGLVVEQLRCITEGKSTDVDFLLRVKKQYTQLLPDYPRFEIAESFFNSVYCRLFDHRSLTPERRFIFSSQPERPFRTLPRPLAKDFFPERGWSHLLGKVLSDLPLRLPWRNKARDIGYIIASLQEALGEELLATCHLQVANELFYRNKAAWLVGKLVMPMATLPFLLPIHRCEEGELFVDTCVPILWFMRRCPARWWNGCARSCRVKRRPSCTWRLAVRSTPKPKAIANIYTTLLAAMSSLLKRRVFAGW